MRIPPKQQSDHCPLTVPALQPQRQQPAAAASLWLQQAP